jgi:hypothetical protein
MQIPSKFEVKTLAEEYHGPCLSLFLPIERIGRETQQNPVRLRHLLREIEQQLEQNPQFASKQTELLEPFQKLPDDEAFWLSRRQTSSPHQRLSRTRCRLLAGLTDPCQALRYQWSLRRCAAPACKRCMRKTRRGPSYCQQTSVAARLHSLHH